MEVPSAPESQMTLIFVLGSPAGRKLDAKQYPGLGGETVGSLCFHALKL